MLTEWALKTRANACARSGEPFREGTSIYTLLHRDGFGFRREDVSEEVWMQIKGEVVPFSYWKSKYEIAPSNPEPLPKATSEELLRKLISEDNPSTRNARFVLALMLERKKLLKPIKTQIDGQERFLIYEHAKTSEVFLISDPQLHLEQLEEIQKEVYSLLRQL
ncbi:MAG: hypothetical protein JO076_01220 [Verrucomicrobia bacterium]|nr:hypothetical protein [Verrucomicrobiota bacterium]